MTRLSMSRRCSARRGKRSTAEGGSSSAAALKVSRAGRAGSRGMVQARSWGRSGDTAQLSAGVGQGRGLPGKVPDQGAFHPFGKVGAEGGGAGKLAEGGPFAPRLRQGAGTAQEQPAEHEADRKGRGRTGRVRDGVEADAVVAAEKGHEQGVVFPGKPQHGGGFSPVQAAQAGKAGGQGCGVGRAGRCGLAAHQGAPLPGIPAERGAGAFPGPNRKRPAISVIIFLSGICKRRSGQQRTLLRASPVDTCGVSR
jgi:hypothetical protein